MGLATLEGDAVNTLPLITLLLLTANAAPRPTVIVVTGAPGNEEYGAMFDEWASRWEKAAGEAEADIIRIGETRQDALTDRDILRQHLEQLDKQQTSTLWLVLIGHGTYDGRQAKFNLNGPDISAEEFVAWLESVEMPTAVINCASSSGPFINKLSGPNRVVVTATKSGSQYNFARFGDYISNAIADEKADLDKDNQTSLLEAFLSASAGVAEFYQEDARLATEHSLLDDNGDALGTPADWFRGFRAVRSAKEGAQPDGHRANQFVLVPRGAEADISDEVRRQRESLENQVETLRRKKDQMEEAEYYHQLESLFVELATLYRDSEQ